MVIISTVNIPHAYEQLTKEYAHIFDGIGTLKDHKVTLYIDESVTPVAQQPRYIPFHMRQKVSDAVDKLECNGIIE